VQHARGSGAPLPELSALIAQLGGRLQLASEAEASERHRALAVRIDELESRLAENQERADALYGELAARLLGRFPALDDAYHPDFTATLERDRAQIAAALDTWPEAARHTEAEHAQDEVDGELQALDVEEAQLSRLLRAYETQALAAALQRRGGAALEHYQALLACERYALTAPDRRRDAPAAARYS
jgi:DNA-binding transcriptional MerR regulator